MLSQNTKAFTAAFRRSGSKDAKHILNALNYKGYLVSLKEIGCGNAHEEGGLFDGEGDSRTVYERYETKMIAYFDKSIMPISEIEKFGNSAYLFDDAIKAGYEKYLIRFEKNENYEVWNYDERCEQEVLANKKVANKRFWLIKKLLSITNAWRQA